MKVRTSYVSNILYEGIFFSCLYVSLFDQNLFNHVFELLIQNIFFFWYMIQNIILIV
jgi:hypothetical protein